MSRLPLAQVTLCAVDTQSPALAAQALLRSMHHVDFASVLLFTHDWLPTVVLPGIDIIDIGPLRSGYEHSTFLMRQLPHFIRTSHLLLTQWDGFVTRPQAWSDEFLVFDYVGAPWLHEPRHGSEPEPEPEAAGVSGFSLLSRRYLAAGMDTRIPQTHPAAEVLCHIHRRFVEQTHGVIFAPAAVTQRFAAGESGAPGPCFGFRGAQHLPEVLPETELKRWLDELPATFFAGPAAKRLLRALLAHRMPAAAAELLARRQATGGEQTDLPLLNAATRLLGALRPTARS